MSDSGLFGQVLSAVQQQFTGSPGRYFLGTPANNIYLMVPPMSCHWPEPPPGQMAAGAYNLANTVPEWSSNGLFSPTDRTVYSAYCELLFQVSLLSPDQRSELEALKEQLLAPSNQLRFGGRDLWSTWHRFLADMERGTVASEYTQAVEAVTPPPPDKSKPGWSLVNQGDGYLVPAPLWSIGKPDVDITVGSHPLTVDLDASQTSLLPPGMGQTPAWPPFWSVLLDGAWTPLDLGSDRTVRATVTMQGTDTVPVTPSHLWYKSDYLNRLAADPNAFNPPFHPTVEEPHVFGQGGLLPLRIASLLVGSPPAFSVTMDAPSLARIRDPLGAARGIRIGPFQFGGEGALADSWVRSVSDTAITGRSNLTDPVIVAVTVTQPGIEVM